MEVFFIPFTIWDHVELSSGRDGADWDLLLLNIVYCRDTRELALLV